MAGFADDELDVDIVDGVAAEPLRRRPDGKTHFARVVCEWDATASSYVVRSAGAQGSHQMASMAAANGLAVLPDGDTIEPGTTVRVRLLRS